MTRIAILGDLHAGVHKDEGVFADALSRFIQDQFVPYLEKKKIKTVIQLGDIVDRPIGISYVAMNRLRADVIMPLLDAGLDVHVIVGNHDKPFKDTLQPCAPVELLTGLGIHVYDRPTEATIDGLQCVMLPWICRDNEKTTADLLRRTKRRVAFGHLELAGFEMYKGSTCVEGMTTELFDGFDLVVSGHFHQPSCKGVIHYVGAPAQYTWADAGCERGFSILDTEKLTLEFVRNRDEMFIELEYRESDFVQCPVPVRNKYVRVNVVERKDANEFEHFIASLEKAGARDIRVIEPGMDVTVAPIDEAETAVFVTNDMKKYIEAVEPPKGIDKTKLENILLKTHAEALAVI